MTDTPIADEHADTRFVKAIRWRVHDADEANHIAQSHRRRAADCRRDQPDMIGEAQQHDLMAAICDEHAEALRRKAAKPPAAAA